MISVRNIWTISKYESMIMWRNWFFRIVGIAGLLFVTIFSISAFSEADLPAWHAISNSWIMPFGAMVLISIPQAAAVAFLATGMIKKDKKIDTNEVFFVRPISNLDYVLGKAFALFKLFFLLNLLLLCVPLIVNLTSPYTSFNGLAFVLAPLLVSVPTIIFICGLSFLAVTVLKNQPVSIILILGLAGVQMIYYFDKYDNILDFTAFRLSLLPSEMSGFANFDFALNQRLFYLLSGIGMMVMSALFMDRLSGKRQWRWAMSVFGGLMLMGSVYLLLRLINDYTGRAEARNDYIKTNNRWISEPNVVFKSHEIDLDLTDGFQASSVIKAFNQSGQSLKQIYFSLNPSLKVRELQIDGKSVAFRQENQIVSISSLELQTGQEITLEVKYEGEIDESVAHLEVDRERYESSNEYFVFNISKKYAFSDQDYTLLTRDVLWYPSPQVGYSNEVPQRAQMTFTNYQLKVKPPDGQVAVSQGQFTQTDGAFKFDPEFPLPDISLSVGNYLKKELEVDSVLYTIYHYPEHDYFSEQLSLIGDTLHTLIDDLAKGYSAKQKMEYPFKRLQLVEAPVHFHSYNKIYETNPSAVQPEIIYWPENGGEMRQFDIRRRKRDMDWQVRSRNEVISEKEKQANIFKDLIKNVFTREISSWEMEGDENDGEDFFIFPMYYAFNSGIVSDKWKFFNKSLSNYLSQKSETVNDYSRNARGISFAEECNKLMRNSTFDEILTSEDFARIQKTVELKSQYLFAYLSNILGDEVLRTFITEWIKAHPHELTSYESFRAALIDAYEFDIDPLLEQTYSGKAQPAYEILRLVGYEVLDEEQKKYQVLIDILNSGDSEGVVEIKVNDQVVQSVITPGQMKQIGVLSNRWPNFHMNTLISHNIPSDFGYPVPFETRKNGEIFEGERILNEKPTTAQYEVIVDNESEGFTTFSPIQPTYLRAYLDSQEETQQEYYGQWFRSYSKWLPTTGQDFYGKVVRSAHFTRSGKGEKTCTWTPQLEKEGFYDVYAFFRGRNQNEYIWRGNHNSKYTYQYRIVHGDGQDNIQYDLSRATPGWNYLGSYYFNTSGGHVVLTDECDLRTVYADAVKWVKQ